MNTPEIKLSKSEIDEIIKDIDARQQEATRLTAEQERRDAEFSELLAIQKSTLMRRLANLKTD